MLRTTIKNYTSVTLTRIFSFILLSILVWDLGLGFWFGILVWDLGLGSWFWDLGLGSWFGILVWDLGFGSWFGILVLGSWLGILGLGSLAWDLWLGEPGWEGRGNQGPELGEPAFAGVITSP